MRFWCRYAGFPSDLAKDPSPVRMYHHLPPLLHEKMVSSSRNAETKRQEITSGSLTLQYQGINLACNSCQDAVSFKWVVWPWSRNKQLNTLQNEPQSIYNYGYAICFVDVYYIYILLYIKISLYCICIYICMTYV
jgi:hypothetical protein